MKVINPYYKIDFDGMSSHEFREKALEKIERIARTCYKSESESTPDSASKFVENLIRRKHHAMIEHVSLSVRFVCDRGVSHEFVRHRIASFAQESTRYCNYSDEKFNSEITFIKPMFFVEGTAAYDYWLIACRTAEMMYFDLLDVGYAPQEARTVLPNSLKTEIIITANLREWLTILKLRTAKDAHPQMRELMIPLQKELRMILPEIFGGAEQ